MKHTPYTIFPFASNIKGLNTRNALSNQDKDSASDLQNVDFNTIGGIRERRGFVRVNSAPLEQLSFVGIRDFKPTEGSQQTVFVVDDKIYKMDSLDGDFDDITGAVSLTSDQNNFVSFATGLDTLIGTNGVDASWKYTQTGNASALSVSNFTLSKFVKFNYQRLIHFATTETTLKGTRIRWSNAGTIETYETDHWLDLNTQDGSEIIGVGNLFDDIYVFKNSFSNGIIKLIYTGDDIVTFDYQTFNEVGASSNGSVVQVTIPGVGPGLVYWGLDNKIRFFDGNSSYAISDSIQPTLDTLNVLYNKYIQAVNFYPLNQIWWFVSDGSSTNHNKVIVYDYLNKSFLIHKGINANIGELVSDSHEIPQLVTGGYNGLLTKQNTGNNDDGAAIDSYYWQSWQDFGDPTASKAIRWAMMYLADLGNYNLNVRWGFNFSDAAFGNVDVNLASGDSTFPFTFPITLGGTTVKIRQIPLTTNNDVKYFRLGFKNSNLNEPWTVYRYDLFAKKLGIEEE